MEVELMTVLNTRQVAKIYGKSQWQVSYAFAQGHFPQAKKIGDFMWLIDKKDLPVKWPVVSKPVGRPKKRG